MKKPRILVVDDEADIRELVSYNLSRNGFQVECAASGEEAVEALRGAIPDLILLDLMLPDLDGLDICRRLRGDARTAHVPVIMLTARGEEADVVAGLELGADDYISKPFSPRVLVARVRAILRRGRRAVLKPGDADAIIRTGPLVIDPGRRRATVGDREVRLTYTEFNILHLLARRPGWVYSRKQIIEAARGDDYPVTERSVDVQIVSLRKKLGRVGDRIETVRGVGYRFREEQLF
ncbi:MAG: response regulator transcription factor [Verrucomicrobia bacterium]|nr:response regulator transcription factor [Verrucomicrobiota bacterium]